MPSKLKLDPESLRVQSFATGQEQAHRGTVQGHAPCTSVQSCPCATGRWACEPRNTNYSCDYTQFGNTCESFPTEVDPSCMC